MFVCRAPKDANRSEGHNSTLFCRTERGARKWWFVVISDVDAWMWHGRGCHWRDCCYFLLDETIIAIVITAFLAVTIVGFS